MLYKPVRHTACSARSGFPAPRFWPTSVAAALLSPHEGRIAKTTNANGDGVTRQGRRSEDAHDPHQPNPAGVRDGELKNARQRNPHQPQ